MRGVSMAYRYSDVTKYNDLRPAVEQILQEQADIKSGWKYVKSKRAFIYQVSKSLSVEIPTGFSPKGTFIGFNFSIRITHKLIKQISEKLGQRKPFSDLMLFRAETRFIPEEYNYGSCTVYLPNTSEIFDEQYKKGNKAYVHLSEFPSRLSILFDLAEAEIKFLFDLSSEEALIRSIIAHPMGTFRGTEVLIIHLMLGQSEYYDLLLKFYNQPAEILWAKNENGFNLNEGFNQPVAEQLMEIYMQGDFPKFDFA
jgi:hypothetical protein